VADDAEHSLGEYSHRPQNHKCLLASSGDLHPFGFCGSNEFAKLRIREMAAQPGVRDLFDNEWIHLAVLQSLRELDERLKALLESVKASRKRLIVKGTLEITPAD